ncbi:hypothetical protein NC651_008422 [Populus alba x Populus x berolinensis]|nr:hypothetical protein NC651_008422 [Populus alba x Populus x berolinensis]
MANNLDTARNIPPGVWLIRKIRGKDWGLKTYRYMVLLITFIAYTSYHASRKPSSIVKSVLDPEPDKTLNVYPWPIGSVFLKDEILGKNKYKSEYTGWVPFNGKGGTKKLGLIDVAFLACYSLGMYGAGHLGDTLDLRLFLTSGMIGSGIFVGLFGMGYSWNIHVFGFYLVVQMVAGLFQATGWPSVVAVIGNWFGKRKRGLIMGIWNAHTSVGNITGSLLAASVLDYGWGWSFIAPGMFIALAGVLVFLFLAAYPEDVGFPCPNVPAARAEAVPRDVESQAQSEEIGGEYMSVKSAGNLSILFDVGGIVGGILAGHISDKLRARAITAASFMYAAIPSMLLYRIYGSFSQTMNIVLMMIAGLFINGPYALITTAVSADLGTHSSLRGDSRALATVTAIIDGTGSIGAALGPLLTGFLSTKGWNTVFVMLMLGALTAGLLLSCQVVAEINDKTSKLMRSTSGLQSSEVPPSQPLLSEQR